MIDPKSNTKQFLLNYFPFNQLSDAALSNLADQLQPWRYRMGQKILERGNMPGQVLILVEGQIRLLAYDSKNQIPVTLQLLQTGSILGAVSLLRRVACETAIASSELVCMALPTSSFLDLLEQHPEFATALYGKCTILEAYELLDNYLSQQARSSTSLKQLALAAAESATTQQVEIGQRAGNLSNDRIWMVSGGQLGTYTVGDQIPGSQDPNSLVAMGTQPVRLVGFLKTDLPTTDAQVSPIGTISSPNGQTSTAALPIAEVGKEVPYASDQLMSQGGLDSRLGSRVTSYPLIRAQGIQDSTVACFQMLAQHLNLPFRREVIRRVVDNHVKRSDAVSLNLCGSISDLMGLHAQLVTLPASAIGQIPAPAMIAWQDGPAIVYETSEQEVVIGSPEQGIQRCKPTEFAASWGESGQVLLIQATKETPQQKFGLSWFLPSLQKHRNILFEVLLASFFVQLFGLANPLMIQLIIDKVLVQNSPDTLQIFGILLLIVAVAEALLSSLRTYLFAETTNRIDMALGSEIIDHLLRLPLRYFDRRPVGELATRVNELENIRQFMTSTALTVVLDAVFSVIYIVVMFIYSPLLTFVALSTIPLFAFLTIFAAPIIRRQLREKAERNAETQSHLVEVLSGIQTVKAQNIELRSRWKWQERYAKYVSAGFKTVVTSTAAGSASQLLNQLSGLLVLWVGAYLVLKGGQDGLSLGQLIAFRIIAGYVTSPLLRLVQLWQNFQQTALSLERLADIVDTPEEADENDRNNIPMPNIRGAVNFENVSFRFGSSGPMQLNNVSLEFPAGTFVGVVGQSGSGKSTLMKLLPRLYETNGGRITIDDYDISKVELYSLRSQIGIVPQDPLLFDGTVQENISLTVPDAPTDDIIDAAKLAIAHDFIMGLSSGYNTRVGERGSSLSGGQRQRIAIARTILQNPQMLILDEATSALDYDTEYQVCQSLIHAFRGRTVFFITHRLSTIQGADVILMMDRGSVVEQGTHNELMALKGRYYCLYQQQQALALS